MQRAFSTIATAGWGGYHAAWGLGLGAHGLGLTVAMPFGLALPQIAGAGGALSALAVLHLGLAGGFGAALMRLHDRGPQGERAEAGVLACLCASIVLAAGLWLFGYGMGEAGTFAGAVTVTAFALFFDRITEVDDRQDEADYRAFLRAGASLGVAMHRPAVHDQERG